jgi:pentose-5-phosphate-3-epimerase/CBS domain-containing protein
MKISASVYSNKEKALEDLVRELDAHEIDMLHVDCIDDEKVFDDIARIRKISKTPVDLHIISSSPEKYLAKIEELQIEYVSFQYENLKSIPALPKNTKTQFGLSITSATSIDDLDKLKVLPIGEDLGGACFSFVMMMATVPGKSGGEFNRESFQRIIEFKNRFPKISVHVDGGVNDEIAYILRLLGVHAVVSGSYLMNHDSLSAGMLSFHKAKKEHNNFRVSEFATPVKYLPVLKTSSLNFKQILETIEQYAMGFVLITDEQGKLTGVVSNADVRRGLLKNLNDLNNVNAETVINAKPVRIGEGATVSDIIRLLNRLNFIVLFLPVVDEQNILKGAVLLNNLTRV